MLSYMPMNKTQLVDKIQEKLGEDVTKKSAELALKAVLDSISEAVAKEKVQIIGFGTFEMKKRAARTGRNPQTGKTMKIAASQTLGFKPSSVFKKALPTPKAASKKSSKKK